MPQTEEVHQYLHSYCIRPNVRFESQNPNEQVILVLRAHPFTQLLWILNSFFFLTILIVANFFLPLFLSPIQIIFVNVFGIVLVLSYVWFNFLNWYFNVGIITNERVVDVDFMHVLYREVTEARLERIEDITSKGGGFFESFFNYGDLFVQTAGTEQNIEFANIPNPSDVVRIISDLTAQ